MRILLSTRTIRTHWTKTRKIQLTCHTSDVLSWTVWTYLWRETRSPKSVREMTNQVYKILAGSPDTLPSFPSGVHTNIHHLLNSNRTWRTTSIQAFASGCTRAKTRMHPTFCKDHATNVYKRSRVARDREGEWAVASVVGSSAEKDWYVSMGNAMDPKDSPPASVQDDKSARLRRC